MKIAVTFFVLCVVVAGIMRFSFTRKIEQTEAELDRDTHYSSSYGQNTMSHSPNSHETNDQGEDDLLDQNPLEPATETSTTLELPQIADIAVETDTSSATNTDNSEPEFTGIVQSPARPLGLEISDYVQAAGSDDASTEFVKHGLPIINEFLDGIFEERHNIAQSTTDLTLEDLTLKGDANVRVYFIKEGTVFKNTLGIHTEDSQSLIFPNASSAHSYYGDADTRSKETNEDIPLIPGDFVDLGNLKAGEILDFFMIQDGARKEDNPVFWTEAQRNTDRISHTKLHGIYDDNTLIIGFEDIPGGGDKDFNDLVFAVEITEPR